ncbi:MAG: amidohydrolase, partial [Desulfobacterales bacterium]|nr:amidohydrolase [Desulfobacterales bacterium]
MINIKDLARDLQPCLVEWRRHFHRYPELSWQEHETSQTVARMLTQIGIPIRKAAGTGVIGSIAGKKPLPVVALRA